MTNRISSKAQIHSIGLSKSTVNLLLKNDIDTVKSLTDKTEFELLIINGMGRRRVNEVIEALATYDLKLQDYEPRTPKTLSIEEGRLIGIPVGGSSPLGKAMVKLLKASGIEATSRLVPKQREQLAKTINNLVKNKPAPK